MPTWQTSPWDSSCTSTRSSAWADTMFAQGSVATTSRGQTALNNAAAVGQEASPLKISISMLILPPSPALSDSHQSQPVQAATDRAGSHTHCSLNAATLL